MLELLTSPEAWIALVSLTLLEIVLGIDNIVFIAILCDRLPAADQRRAYKLGLAGAMISRLGLLFALNWVAHLETELFHLLGHSITARDLILLGGGIFLIGKSAHEIYEKVEANEEEEVRARARSTMFAVVLQITVLDIVFSIDSVITAVGMANDVEVMAAAIIIAVVIMLLFARPVGNFVNTNPSMKLLALAFLLLIGVLLTAEAFDQHIDKGYIYFAMGFGLVVEMLNLRRRKKSAVVRGEEVVDEKASPGAGDGKSSTSTSTSATPTDG